MCLCLCGTPLVLVQLNCKLDIVRLWTEYRVRSRTKLEHFLVIYMYVKRAILRTLYIVSRAIRICVRMSGARARKGGVVKIRMV